MNKTNRGGGAGTSAPSIQLRQYQTEAIDAVRGVYRSGDRSAMIVLATGTGKTFTALTMVRQTIQRGGRVLWLAHRSELVEQPVAAWDGLAQFRDTGRAGIVQGSRDDRDADLVCASTATVGRNADSPAGRLAGIMRADAPPVRLVVIDECHHYAADGLGLFAGVAPAIDAWAADLSIPAPYRLGLTATPERMDGRDLSGLWGSEPAYVYSYQRAIAEGYLCPPTTILDRLEMDDETRAIVAAARETGDEVDRETARALLDSGLVEHTVASMGRHLRGRACLLFTCDLEQAGMASEMLTADGWRSAVVSGETPKAQRRALLRMFQAGQLDVLVNCNVLTEGTDLPRCDAVVMARPFSSKVLFIQAVGRGLRLYPGKGECLVLDVLGATEEHTLAHAAGLLTGAPPKREPFRGLTKRTLTRDEVRVVPRTHVQCVPRDEVPEGDDRDYLLVAIIMGEHESPLPEPIPVRRGRDVAAEGEGGTPLPDLLRERRRVEGHWVPVPGSGGAAMVADCGDHGSVWLVDLGDGWMSYHLPKRARKPRPLERAPMDAGYARGLADDLFRQAEGLVRSRAPWRERDVSDGQRAYAERLGLQVVGHSRGAYSDAICAEKARRLWAKKGASPFVHALKVLK